MSVAKIFSAGHLDRRVQASINRMAIEYASSPVAQAATQTRSGSLPSCASTIRGITSLARMSNASVSRKNRVTGISSSRRSALSSLLSDCRIARYSVKLRQWRTCIRRSTRRITVPGL